jgi:hypothetical protein
MLTAVRTSVSPARLRPSGAKLGVLSKRGWRLAARPAYRPWSTRDRSEGHRSLAVRLVKGLSGRCGATWVLRGQATSAAWRQDRAGERSAGAAADLQAAGGHIHSGLIIHCRDASHDRPDSGPASRSDACRPAGPFGSAYRRRATALRVYTHFQAGVEWRSAELLGGRADGLGGSRQRQRGGAGGPVPAYKERLMDAWRLFRPRGLGCEPCAAG